MQRRIIFLSALIIFLVLLGIGVYFLFARPGGITETEAVPNDQQGKSPAFKPRYEMAIDLDYDSHRARIRETVIVTNQTEEKWEKVVFSVPPAVRPEVFGLNWATVTIKNDTQTIVPVITGSMAVFELPQAIEAGDQLRIDISFQLILRKLDKYEVFPTGNLGYNDIQAQFGDFFPTLTPYDPGIGFREWEYVPVGDPYVYPVADFDVRIKADDDVLVAAPGLVTHDGNNWEFVIDGARSFAFAAGKYYDFMSASAGETPLYCYFIKGNEHAAEVILKTARECVDLYSRLYGPYPYRELNLVQNSNSSGMEYSALVMLSNNNIREYSDSTPQFLLVLTAHEIAHEWWYGAVGNDQVKEAWLDEGLAKYSEFLYFRAYHPDLLGWWQSLLAVKRPENRFIDDPIQMYRETPKDYTRVIYGLAPAFLQELHNKIGEQAFFDFLKNYYNEGKDHIVTARDFFSILGRHTDADITPLLQKYFRTAP
jgi:hypothetical protein